MDCKQDKKICCFQYAWLIFGPMMLSVWGIHLILILRLLICREGGYAYDLASALIILDVFGLIPTGLYFIWITILIPELVITTILISCATFICGIIFGYLERKWQNPENSSHPIIPIQFENESQQLSSENCGAENENNPVQNIEIEKYILPLVLLDFKIRKAEASPGSEIIVKVFSNQLVLDILSEAHKHLNLVNKMKFQNLELVTEEFQRLDKSLPIAVLDRSQLFLIREKTTF